MAPPPEKDEMSDSQSDFSGFDSDDDDQVQRPRQTQPETAAMFDKDSEEEDLERLVLGNQAGFRQSLFAGDAEGDSDVEYGDADGEAAGYGASSAAGGSGLEDVADHDLFMVDTEKVPTDASKMLQAGATSDMALDGEGAPAWEDSDDGRLAISLAGASRLRRLRATETEDMVSGAEYSRRLRKQFLALNPAPAWAKPREQRDKSRSRRRRRSSATGGGSASESSDSDDSDDNDGSSDVDAQQPLEKLLRSVSKLAGLGGGRSRTLRPEVIDIQRTREIPDKHRAAVENIAFHPTYPVLMSCSKASVLHMHHVAPEAHPTPNPPLTSVQVKQVGLRRAEFLHPQGDRVFFAGRRRYFHQWDLPSGTVQKTTQIQGHQKEHRSMENFRLSPCGRYMGIVASVNKGCGIVNIINTKTMQWLAAARLTSTHGIADFAWWRTGDGMTVLGRDGTVGEYDVASRSFVALWQDEGSVGGTVIALGGHGGPPGLGRDRWVAVGSTSGVANVYERNDLLDAGASQDRLVVKERPEPRRRLEQLVTAITVLTFSPDGQLLAFGSKARRDALKLVHLPSCTVFRNWPTQQTPLGKITAVAFGQQSDLLAVGNDQGKIRLWQIRS